VYDTRQMSFCLETRFNGPVPPVISNDLHQKADVSSVHELLTCRHKLRARFDQCATFSSASMHPAARSAAQRLVIARHALRRSMHSTGAARNPQPSSGGVHSSVDPTEVAKFAAQAGKWWDPNGYAAPLHRMNPVRVAFIRAAIENRMSNLGVRFDPQSRLPLAGASVVDVGCGGGLVTEPLARLGADVLGVDMSVQGVVVAKEHARRDPGLVNCRHLQYRVSAVEDLVREGLMFDTVLALEIVEHVADPAVFLQDCAALVKPGGLMIMSTLNRTAASYALGIVAAERILKWLPAGTHDWNRFPTPEEVAAVLETDSGLVCDEIIGVSFNPFSNSFAISNNTSVNYMLTAHRPMTPAEEVVVDSVPPSAATP
jgi:2-polyprenyl-6-hydroxyphenyl methylase / 3-demethylubiquinone-9 3-methyltransferase